MRIFLLSFIVALVATMSFQTPAYAKSRSAKSSSCKAIVCPNGKTYPTCSRQGYPINYFVYPCRF